MRTPSRPASAGATPAHRVRQTALRERTRAAVRNELSRVAMELFVEHGFDQITVSQIAASAGVSPRSFFRYFPTKEDAVLAHLVDVGHAARAVLRERPADEEPWTALRAAFEPSLTQIRQDTATSLAIYRMLMQSPSLRATHAQKGQQWCDLLEPEIARRLRPAAESAHDARPRAIVAAALACYDAACLTWTHSGAAVPIETLLDDALRAVRP